MLVMDAKTTAAALGISPQKFRAIRDELERSGFPQPLPIPSGDKRPQLKWARAAVCAWIDRHAAPTVSTAERRLFEMFGGCNG